MADDPKLLRSWRLIVSLLAGTVACGAPYWPVAYRDVSLPGTPATSTLLIGGAAAGLLASYLLRPTRFTPILVTAGGFVLAVMGRVTVEVAADPTSHNLWPFEVVIIGGIGLVAGAIGTGIGLLLWRRPEGGAP